MNKNNSGLTLDEEKTLKIIKSKWLFHNDVFCEPCLHISLKNLNNSIIPKECQNECMHPNTHASALFSQSGVDVYNLLKIINKLKKEIDIVKNGK